MNSGVLYMCCGGGLDRGLTILVGRGFLWSKHVENEGDFQIFGCSCDLIWIFRKVPPRDGSEGWF